MADSSAHPSTILHMVPRFEYEIAKEVGFYEAASLALEGFIHFSTKDIVLKVANMFYKDTADMVILVVDVEALKAAGGDLRWDYVEHMDATFPHLYGQLPISAVSRVVEFPCNEDGQFSMPADL